MEPEFRQVAVEANKAGWKALWPSYPVGCIGSVLFLSLFVTNIVAAALFEGQAGTDAYFSCTASARSETKFQQCRAGEVVSNQSWSRNDAYTPESLNCCNFWCCGDKPIHPGPYSQIPWSTTMRNLVDEQRCEVMESVQIKGRAAVYGYYEGGSMIARDCQQDKGLFFSVEGSTALTKSVQETGWPLGWHWFIGITIFLSVMWFFVTAIVFRCVCYRKAILKVFTERFGPKGVQISWQWGGKRIPNFVRLHVNGATQNIPEFGSPVVMPAPVPMPQYPTPTAVVVAPAQQQISTTIPAGAKAGQMIEVTAPDGRTLQVKVPDGKSAGDQILINVPPAQ